MKNLEYGVAHLTEAARAMAKTLLYLREQLQDKEEVGMDKHGTCSLYLSALMVKEYAEGVLKNTTEPIDSDFSEGSPSESDQLTPFYGTKSNIDAGKIETKNYTAAEAKLILTLTPDDGELVGRDILAETDPRSSSAATGADDQVGEGCIEANIYSFADIVTVIVDEVFLYPGRPAWTGELARFGPYESVEAGREFVDYLKKIGLADYQPGDVEIKVQYVPQEEDQPSGTWIANAGQRSDGTGGWFSFVEFEEDDHSERLIMSRPTGPFQYMNQAVIMALAEARKIM